jgi:hypothetical protein
VATPVAVVVTVVRPPAPSPAATAAPTAAPTVQVAAAPPDAAARPPAPIPTAQPTEAATPSATDLRAAAAAAEAALRSGLVHAAVDHGGGAEARATLRLDLGDGRRPPRFHLSTTYRRAAETQTVEYIAVGDRYWRRLPDGDWAAVPAQPGLWDHVRTFLPRIGSAQRVESVAGDAASVGLRWYDEPRRAEVTLTIDPATGAPRELREVGRETGLARTIRYSGWNAPVAIEPPAM